MSPKPAGRLLAACSDYLTDLIAKFSLGWNRFWFTPTDVMTVCVLRIGCGCAALIYIISHSADLTTWWGPHGLLPAETVQELAGTQLGNAQGYRWSYFYSIEDPSLLWAAHLLGLASAIGFTLGLFTRLTNLLTLVAVLSYVHRAPMLTGPWEPVLTMSLLYLCLAPCGAVWSLDSRRRRREAELSGRAAAQLSSAATVATRLIQVHLAALYFTMGVSKLAGDTWWLGEAVWWLIAHSESRLIDLTGLRSSILLVNLWSHVIVLFELSFAILIWVRAARPLLLAIAIAMWGSLGILTGQLGFCGMMVVANLSFLDAGHFRTLGIGNES